MFQQQAVVRPNRHRSEFVVGDISDEIDVKRIRDREARLFIEIRATSDGVNQNWFLLQEEGGHENTSESCMNAACHVLVDESEEVIHQQQRIYDGGFDWVDEPEEGLEDSCGLRDLDDGESGVALGRLRGLGDGEHITEDG